MTRRSARSPGVVLPRSEALFWDTGEMPRSSSPGDGRNRELPNPGDRVEYLESGVFDQMIVRGDVGIVQRVEDGWVFATWLRTDQTLSVPIDHVRLVTA